MRNLFVIFMLWLMVASDLGAEQPLYDLGANVGLARLDGGDQSYFPYQLVYGGQLGYCFASRWDLSLDVTRLVLHDDTTAQSPLALGGAADHDSVVFKGWRVGLMFNRNLLREGRALQAKLGLGGGLMLWKMVDAAGDRTLKTVGPQGEPLDLAASEVILSGRLTLGYRFAGRWWLRAQGQLDYLSGMGADFATAVKKSRDNIIPSVMVGLTVGLGGSERGWQSDPEWSRPARPAAAVDSDLPDEDGDGVADEQDRCPNTAAGVPVNALTGCPLDSDNDGVIDGRDDCPRTDRRARGQVDISGCPIDSDFDGVADYLDQCPHNAVGATVDTVGCPVDTDGDGVPDGLDDCPHTLTGMTVDRRGCIDLAMLAEPMVLNIDYSSGSFEIDPKTRGRLEALARLLLFVADVRLEINGYTDNIGLPTANQKLSEKRANRVRDFLVAQGVDEARMKVFGRGETNFVASNQTAEGRAKNRRVEINFYQ
ncbi:MAG: OmpA family protein [bacterium]